MSVGHKAKRFNYSSYLEKIYNNRHKLKCCTFVAKAGDRGWFCVCCPVPHHVRWLPPWKRRQSYEKYNKPIVESRKAAGVCLRCGNSIGGSPSIRYCIKHHAKQVEYHRRSRERSCSAIRENLYGGRMDFQQEDIRIQILK